MKEAHEETKQKLLEEAEREEAAAIAEATASAEAEAAAKHAEEVAALKEK
jgi:hypothetical protein